MDINSLALAADVPVRTVRFYISEGILESPLGRGKSAAYTEEHLLRLRAARRLAEQRVPLEEIRRILPPLSKKELEDLIGKSDRRTAEENRAKSLSPKAYVSSLLERALPADVNIVRESPAEYQYSPSVRPAGGESWLRYPVMPGIELHVSGSAARKHRDLVKKILRELGGTQ